MLYPSFRCQEFQIACSKVRSKDSDLILAGLSSDANELGYKVIGLFGVLDFRPDKRIS